MKKSKIEIVFVCLGNYCRSPMAEAIFNKLAEEDGLQANFQPPLPEPKTGTSGCVLISEPWRCWKKTITHSPTRSAPR